VGYRQVSRVWVDSNLEVPRGQFYELDESGRQVGTAFLDDDRGMSLGRPRRDVDSFLRAATRVRNELLRGGFVITQARMTQRMDMKDVSTFQRYWGGTGLEWRRWKEGKI